jgi:hypothetical protein
MQGANSPHRREPIPSPMPALADSVDELARSLRVFAGQVAQISNVAETLIVQIDGLNARVDVLSTQMAQIIDRMRLQRASPRGEDVGTPPSARASAGSPEESVSAGCLRSSHAI